MSCWIGPGRERCVSIKHAVLLSVLIGAISYSAQMGVTTSAEIRMHLERAQQALTANKPEEAAREFREVLRLDPTNVQARGDLGVVAFVRGDWSEAAVDFRDVLKLHSSLPRAQALLGMTELHLGQSVEAQRLLKMSFSHLPNGELREQAGEELARIYYHNGELEKAAAVLSILQRIDPHGADVFYAVFRTYTDLALQAVYQLALIAPRSGRLHEALAEHLVNGGDVKDAIVQYRKALQLSPNLAGAHFELGEALLQYSRSGKILDQAQKQFEIALAGDPVNASSQCKLGDIYRLRSNPRVASEHYLCALKLNAKNACAEIGLGELLIEEGHAREALSYLREARLSEPFNPTARYQLAMLYRKLGRTEDASREWLAFQQLDKVRSELRQAFQEAPILSQDPSPPGGGPQH